MLDGLTHWLKTYGDKGDASFKDFKEGVSESTFGDVNAIKSVLTTGGTAQDWIAVAMLLTPAGGKGKNALQNNITDTPNNKKTPTETDTSNNKKDDENASVKPKNTTFDTENQNKKGEAYAEGGDAPIPPKKPSFKIGESDGGGGTWEQRTTPKSGADYQRQVTKAPPNVEYVVKTDKMASGEKKFDGYEPEKNTLIDAKDWSKWPPKGESNWAKRRREQMLENAKKDLDIAQNTNPPSKLKWIVSDKKNAKYLEKLFEKKGIDIEVEFIEKIVK